MTVPRGLVFGGSMCRERRIGEKSWDVGRRRLMTRASCQRIVTRRQRRKTRNVPWMFPRIWLVHCFQRGKNGLPGGTRTPDLLLRRQLLYPVELRAGKAADGPARIIPAMGGRAGLGGVPWRPCRHSASSSSSNTTEGGAMTRAMSLIVGTRPRAR